MRLSFRFFIESETDIFTQLSVKLKQLAMPFVQNGDWEQVFDVVDDSTWDEESHDEVPEGSVYINTTILGNSFDQILHAVKQTLATLNLEVKSEKAIPNQEWYGVAFHGQVAIRLPKIAFHVTPSTNLQLIKTQGIVPQGGAQQPGWEQHGSGKIFLTSDLDTAKRLVFNFKAKRKEIDWVILKVNLSGIKEGYIDNFTPNSFYIKEKIPPAAIIEEIPMSFSNKKSRLIFNNNNFTGEYFGNHNSMTVRGTKENNVLFFQYIKHDNAENYHQLASFIDNEKAILPNLVNDICQTNLKTVILNRINAARGRNGIFDDNIPIFKTLLGKCGVNLQLK